MKGDFRVGDWFVRPGTGTVSQGEKRIRLEPRVMEVLVYLARHSNEVLPKERILAAVWNDSFVTDEVLTNAISTLRNALGDNARDPSFIQTLHRRGYRLIARVSLESDPEVVHQGKNSLDPATGRPTRWLRPATLMAVPLAVALIAYFFQPMSPPEPEPVIDSIAILPFENLGDDGDPESESLSDGIPASIGSSLLRLPQLRVKPASVLRRYKGRAVPPRTVSEEQGVRAVLTGTIERRGDTLGVKVELIDGSEDFLIWGKAYARTLSDILTIESDIAGQVAQALRVRLTDDQSKSLERRGSKNHEAYLALSLGQYHARRFPSPDAKTSLSFAIPYFEDALALDPRYQEAYYDLAHIYFVFGKNDYDSAVQDYSKAREYLEKLVTVDPWTEWAHEARAMLLWMYDRNWEEAEKEYRKARELDAPRLYRYNEFLEWMGRRDDSLAHIERGLELADPFDPVPQTMFAWRLLWARDYDRAIEHARKALELEPQWVDPWVIISFSYELKGMEKEAFESGLEALKNGGAPAQTVRAAREAFEQSGMEGVRRLTGYHHAEGRGPRPISRAMSFIRQGDEDRAFDWLDRSWDLPLWGAENAPSSPFLDPIREDPRFEQLLRKQKLPEEVIARHLGR